MLLSLLILLGYIPTYLMTKFLLILLTFTYFGYLRLFIL